MANKGENEIERFPNIILSMMTKRFLFLSPAVKMKPYVLFYLETLFTFSANLGSRDLYSNRRFHFADCSSLYS